uniref:Uncharacterized protein n=1 Tax=Escherichia coli TaxID=562 RepID=A0A7U0Q6A5_ECOLX|nr:hypothetical protein [Escherichia coli]
MDYFTFNVVPRYKNIFIIPFIYIAACTENGKENKNQGKSPISKHKK